MIKNFEQELKAEQKKSVFKNKNDLIEEHIYGMLGINRNQMYRTVYHEEFGSIINKTFKLGFTSDEISLLHF